MTGRPPPDGAAVSPPSTFSGDAVLDGRAWRAFCERLADLGERILGEGFPSSPRDRAEGVRHLATQTVAWLGWAVGHGPATHPTFFRQNDLVVRWGGPNVDQTTRRARVAADGTYRIQGHMGACEDFILTLKDGDMHEGRYGILHEAMASELGIRPGDEIDLVVSAEPPTDLAAGSHWVPLPPDATMLNVREYYFDWRPLPPAIITIGRVDTAGTAPPVLDPGLLGRQLDDAIRTIEHSLSYWNEWVAAEWAKVGTNVLSAPGGTAGGSSLIAYGFGFFDLGPDEVWLIETDVPAAQAYDVQLYSLGWFESLDFANRTTSLNHTQLRTGSDGRLRIVVAHTDPGVPNWLDTEGRAEAMLTYRWINTRTRPAPVARVVKAVELRSLLPADTPTIDAASRAEEIAARQAHAAWRYRT